MNRLLIVVLGILFLTACSPNIPNSYRKSAERLQSKIVALEKLDAQSETDFTQFMRGDDWKIFQRYAEKENWSNYNVSKSEFTNLKKEQAGLEKLLKNDKKGSVQKIKSKLLNIDEMIGELTKKATFIQNRIQVLEVAMKLKDEVFSRSSSLMRISQRNVNDFAQFKEKISNNHPTRSKDIEKKSEIIVSIFEKLEKNFTIVEDQYKSSEPDYALFANNANELKVNSEALGKEIDNVSRSLKSLNNDYIVFLTDMRIDYKVQIARSSWEESYFIEYPKETTYIYDPITVSSEVFSTIKDEFRKCPSNLIKCDESLPRSDNSAEYWVEDSYAEYWQQHQVIENGVQKDPIWINLGEEYDNPEEVYKELQDAKGMQIEGKLYGEFEEETVFEPLPPAINAVGNPHYGEYRQDNNGNTFWHYYGQYSMIQNLLGGNSYSSHDYDAYRNRDRNTYGYYSGAGRSYGTRLNETSRSSGTGRSSGTKGMRTGSSIRGGGPRGSK